MAGLNSAAPISFLGVSSTVSALSANSPQLGDRLFFGGVEHVFGYNAGTTALAPGLAGVLNAAATSYSFTISSVTTTDLLLGVCRHATIATGFYGWLATRGFTTVQMHADQSATSGDFVGLGVNGAFIKHVTSGATDVAYGTVFGKFPVSIASGASGSAYIKAY